MPQQPPWRNLEAVSASSGDVTGVTGASLDLERATERATDILQAWDRSFNAETTTSTTTATATATATATPTTTPTTTTTTTADSHDAIRRAQLRPAIQHLNAQAARERTQDSTQGRVMLGICASSAALGMATLKSWVTALALPRGLLHGMDQDGVPLRLEGGVYIKYNSGGVYSFADIRKSGKGFEALWKPGDAMLEPYDGTYRGVYFQVELVDGVFRQFLVPVDVFDPIAPQSSQSSQ